MTERVFDALQHASQFLDLLGGNARTLDPEVDDLRMAKIPW